MRARCTVYYMYALFIDLVMSLECSYFGLNDNAFLDDWLTELLGMNSCECLLVDNLTKLKTISCQCKQAIDISGSSVVLLALGEPRDS